MAWTTPSSQSQGDLISLATWNANVVANPQYLYDNLGILDAKVGFSQLAAAANFSFTSLPSSYDSLFIKGYLRSTYTVGTSDTLQIRFNNDSGSNYRFEIMQSSAGTASGINGSASGQSSLFGVSLGVQSSHATPGTLVYSMFTLEIPSYANSSYYKAVRATSMYQTGAATTATIQTGVGWWRAVDAINRIDIAATNGTFEVGSYIAIFATQSV